MGATQSVKFGHFGINCFDIARMEDFYTRVMGMIVAMVDLHPRYRGQSHGALCR